MKKAALAALLATLVSGACGGGGGSNPPPNDNPPPSQNVCASAATAEADPSANLTPTNPEKRSGRADGSNRWRVLDAIYAHRQARDRGFGVPEGVAPRDTATEDIGQIAVIQDDGELIIPANQYDLRDLGLRFTRNGAGGYDVTRIAGGLRTAIGQRITLSDDDTRQMNVAFGFPFYGTNRTVAFVNSDGNITFGEGDNASLDRSVARLLTGPPRVSPFFADLDPSAGGSIFVNAAADQYTVTWCGVRGFDDARTTTVQATLLPSGDIEMKFSASINLPDAVVGVSPGRTGDFTPVDLSAQGPTGGGAGAVGERFASQSELDILEVANKFYRTHPDNYDQLIIWTDAPAIRDAFAFETTVRNDIRGIGLDTFDFGREFGSAAALGSLVVMDWLGKYSDDPNAKILGENTNNGVLGQEVGHRWLAFLNFQFAGSAASDALLGRDSSHWSFFFDSDASVMEGNDIRDNGGGSFETVAAVQRYSRLDLYAMGLAAESEVPPFFYVENPTNVSRPNTDRGSAPRVGVTFNGTKREVLIQDIVRANQGRFPPAGAAIGGRHRQAFLYVVGRGRQTESSQVSKLDRIRTNWETFFRQATENRMTAVTALR